MIIQLILLQLNESKRKDSVLAKDSEILLRKQGNCTSESNYKEDSNIGKRTMRNEKYDEICGRYYKLSKKPIINLQEEQEITEILNLTLEDAYLSSLIDRIDNQLYEENESLHKPSEVELVAELLKVKSYIKNVLSQEGGDHLSETRQLLAVDYMTDYVKTLVQRGSPQDVLLTFQKIFVKGESYLLDSKLSRSIDELTDVGYTPHGFSTVLHDCLYVVVNEWMTKPSHQKFIAQLISLFDQKEILKFSHSQKPCVLRALLDFTQTDQFIQLFRLSNCVRYQLHRNLVTDKELRESNCVSEDGLPVTSSKQMHTSHIEKVKVQQHEVRQVLSVQERLRGDEFSKTTTRRSETIHMLEASVSKVSNDNLLSRIKARVARICSQVQPTASAKRNTTQDTFAVGVVVTPITSEQLVRVRINGVFWRAELRGKDTSSLQPGARVKVVGRKDITLIVEPYEEEIPRPVVPLKKPMIGITKDPITFSRPGKIMLQGKTRSARLHEGFEFNPLYTRQKVKVVALDGDVLVVTPLNPLAVSKEASFEHTQRSKVCR